MSDSQKDEPTIMDPHAGDTVTSTKSPSTTTPSEMKTIKTTGERSCRLSLQYETKGWSRKRRQPEQPSQTRPEINAPPVKSRLSTSEVLPSTSGRSRIGDFFSGLTSRIRGPRIAAAENARQTKEKNSQDGKLKSQVLEFSEECDDSTKQILNCDASKKRKIETGENSKISLETSKENLSDCDSNKSKISDNEEINKPQSDVKLTAKLMTVEETSSNLTICDYHSAKDNFLETLEESEKANKTENFISSMKEFNKKSAVKEEGKKTEILPKNMVRDIPVKVRRFASVDQSIVRPNETLERIDKSTNTDVLVNEEKDKSFGSSSSHFSVGSLPHSRRDEVARMRKTIHWLEEGARRLREDLANVRMELHEERRAAKIKKSEYEAAIIEVKKSEAAKYNEIIASLKNRSQPSINSSTEVKLNSTQTEHLKDENHKREIAVLKKRFTKTETALQKFKRDSLEMQSKKNIKETKTSKTTALEMRKLEAQVLQLRLVNKKLQQKLQIAEESAKARAAELRMQHEKHEVEVSTLQRSLRRDTVKMINEMQAKTRLIEKLEKANRESEEANRKLRDKEEETMRKLRESERSHQIRLPARIEEKIHHDKPEVDICKVECAEEESVDRAELERVKELAAEQQEVIEVLRQALKEKERKLDQLMNKRRKEEFYRQFLDLEPVAEVDDEYDHEEGDSALSSAPSSLSPQPGAGRSDANANHNAVTREAYESLLLEVEEVQTRLQEEQQELFHARSQVRDLEKALLQETRGSQNSRRALTKKLRDAEERETRLVAEISELREQNELLEFRVLELEESPMRDTPDPADSGIVSPEPIQLYKDHQVNKHRDRAVATVIPYTSTYHQPVLPSDPQKAPLSLQESGIFEAEDHEEDEDTGDDHNIELSCQSTQTEAPAGELLQEVQRLQELRARIQERAAKVPPPISPTNDKSEASCELVPDVATPLRERIRELEEQLNALSVERQERKQREEELLDENYRLTEKMYLFEEQLKDLQKSVPAAKETSDADTMTDKPSEEPIPSDTVDSPEDSTSVSRCQSLYKTAVLNLDPDAKSDDDKSGFAVESRAKDQLCENCSELWKECDARIQDLVRTEFCLRQKIDSLEHRESAFFETLRQADATWAKLEADYECKHAEISQQLNAQIEINRALVEHLAKLNKSVDKQEPMEVDVEMDAKKSELSRETQTEEADGCYCQRKVSLSRSSSTSTSTGVIVRADASRVSTISRTSIKMPLSDDRDEIDTNASKIRSIGKPIEPPTEVATEAKEEDDTLPEDQGSERNQQEQLEPLVSIDKSSTDMKQIIYFRWR